PPHTRAAERTQQPVTRVQVQRQIHAPISSTAATIQASQQKVAQLNALQNASGAYYSNSWVASFGAPDYSSWASSFGGFGYGDDAFDSGEFDTGWLGDTTWRS